MPTTATGIVYPDDQGHTRLWEHFQALAETTDTAIANTESASPWTSLPSPALATGGIRYRTLGPLVELSVTGTLATPVPPNMTTTIATLPEKIRPDSTFYAVINSSGSGMSYSRLDIGANGVLAVHNSSAATGSINLVNQSVSMWLVP